MRRVGILGGMGPQATVLLMQKVIAAVPGNDDADHIPLLVDQNPQVPSRIKFLVEGHGEDPAPVLARMAAGLAQAGAEALAMPCNTAHYFGPAIRAAVSVPFLDMVSLSIAHARKLAEPGGTVGILASPATRKVGLFDAAFGQANIVTVYPEDDAAMLAAIRRIKSAGPVAEARAALQAASEELLAKGARVQMVACTEFSLIASSVAQKAESFDTLDVLVGAIKNFALEGSAEKAGVEVTA
jgi:aspartate racemase